MDDLGEQDGYKVLMIRKLILWDWSKITFNTFTTYFDEAYSVFSDSPKTVTRFEEKLQEFQDKYNLTVNQAEIKIYMRIIGSSNKRLVRENDVRHETYGSKPINKDSREREVNWLDMVEDLRMIKVWILLKLKEESTKIGLVFA